MTHGTRWTRLKDWLTHYFVVVAAILVTLGAWLYVRSSVQSVDAARFSVLSSRIENDIRSRMQAYVNALYQARSTFAIHGWMDRAQFHDYIEGLSLKRYPGIQGFGLALKVPSDQIDAVERKVRRAGHPEFRVWPETDAPVRFPITLIEPMDWRNQRAVGYDMFTDPVRREAMLRALYSGNASASGIVTLVQESGKQQQRGFLVFVPLYKRGMPLESAQQRIDALLGFVYAPFRAEDLFGTVSQDADAATRQVDFQVFDGQRLSASDLIYDRQGVLNSHDIANSRFQDWKTIEVGGRKWTIAVSALPAFVSSSDRWLALWVLLGGLLISFLLYWLRRSERLASERERSLFVQEQASHAEAESQRHKLRSLFEQAPALLCALRGPELKVELVSPRVQQLLGDRIQPGKTLRELIPEVGAKGFYEVIRRVYETGEAFRGYEYPLTFDRTGRGDVQEGFFTFVCQPTRRGGGEIEGILILAVEVTEQVRSQRNFERSETRFRVALESARIASWEWDLISGQGWRSEGHDILYGLPGNQASWDRERFLALIHPEDRDQVRTRFFVPAHGQREINCEYRVHWPDGSTHWLLSRGILMGDGHGQPSVSAGATMDVTQIKRAEENERFLNQVSAMLTSSLDYENTLKQAVDLCVPVLADCAFLDLADEKGSIHRVAVAVADPALSALDPQATSFPACPRLGKSPFLVGDMSRDGKDRMASGPEHEKVIGPVGPLSMICVPLAARERVFGALTLITTRHSGRKYQETDLRFFEELARRAAMSVDNARLFHDAREAVRARDEFLSIASHELKTPLTPLRLQLQGFSRRVAQGGLTQMHQESLAKLAQTSDQQIARLTALIDELLDVSRIDAGRFELNRQKMDLAQLVRETAQRFDELARSTGSEIQVDAPENAEAVADRLRMEQVIANLVTNALKYAPGKPVRLALETRADRAVLTVEDQGPGIPAGDLRRIFKRFERVSPTQGVGGLGLGLYIAQQIVEAHDGHIRAESEPGKGTRFVVEIPVSAAKISSGRVA